MEQLNNGFLDKNGGDLKSLEIGFPDKKRPEKILQFGEGNFLRAFVDFFIDELNGEKLFDGNIVIVQPIGTSTTLTDIMNAQDGNYTVVLRGLENNAPVVRQRIITSVSRVLNLFRDFNAYMETMKNPDLRFIVSNTTEAGIVYAQTDKPDENATDPPASFPAKITALLYERYKNFNGAADKGFIFIPCELIDNNGTELKQIVLRHANEWHLPQSFINWVNESNHFTNTLVDRIVTGYPKDEVDTFAQNLGYEDKLLVTGEIFHFFAIEASEAAAKEMNETLPFKKAGQSVVLTSDATPYKLRKVRILNGAHTMSVLAAYLSGKDTVGEMMEDQLFVDFLQKGIYKEIIPALDGVPADELKSFADSVFDRFRNPHIKHYLLSIALNSVSKFKARVLPSILDYYKKNNALPEVLTLSFAALIAFYKGTEIKEDALVGLRAGESYKIADSADVLAFFQTEWQNGDADSVAKATLSNKSFWDADLTEIPGLSDAVAKHLRNILANGVKNEIESIVGA